MFRGRTGHGDGITSCFSPKLVESLKKYYVTEASALGGHSVVLTSRDRNNYNSTCRVFTWGLGALGGLGHRGDADESSPRQVAALKGMDIKAVSQGCFSYHSVLVTEAGQLVLLGEWESHGFGARKRWGMLREHYAGRQGGATVLVDLPARAATSLTAAAKSLLAPTVTPTPALWGQEALHLLTRKNLENNSAQHSPRQ